MRVFGPGVQKDGVSVNKPTSFTVDTTAAGSAPLDLSVSARRQRGRCWGWVVCVKSDEDGVDTWEAMDAAVSVVSVVRVLHISVYVFRLGH